jgi:hypothetical protein
VRECLKKDSREAAKKRETILVRMARWEQGKASGPSSKSIYVNMNLKNNDFHKECVSFL